VRVTVSTDDPPFFHTTMTREYDMLAQTFGWDSATFQAVNQTAAEAAFCNEATRAQILKKLEN
jgi:adenosine deaminase